MRPVFIKTFGCKVNYTESVSAAEQLLKLGIAAQELTGSTLPAGLGSPVVVVNSCCVTKEAERKALQFVRRMLRLHTDAEVLFTGCAARHDEIRRRFSEAGAHIVEHYPEVIDLLRDATAAPAGAEAETVDLPADHHAPLPAPSRSRAFIKVQDGCTCRCSYCIIPDVRPYYTRPPDEIFVEIEQRCAEGYRELVLTGINAGHYGRAPLPREAREEYPTGSLSLAGLLADSLERLPNTTRLRLSSVEPEDVDDRLLDVFKHPQMCPHLHIPLQSGSDSVLADMRRPYSAEQYAAVAGRFRRACPAGAISTDILVGYPTETADDFQATLDLCTAVGFERIHGFPFSPRPGTPAAELAPLPGNVVKDRNRRLILHCGAIARTRWERFLGTAVDVLVEERRGDVFIGHGPAYQVVCIPAGTPGITPGHIQRIQLTGLSGDEFDGRPV